MRITGLDEVTLGVTDLSAALHFCRDFGLIEVSADDDGAVFATRDRSLIVLRRSDDPNLRPANVEGSTVREIVWRVGDEAELQRIAAELGRDREVVRGADGTARCVDDDGYCLAFRHRAPAQIAPRAPRGVNVRAERFERICPRAVSHIVLHTPDAPRSTEFYVDRLGFSASDFFEGEKGAFLRPAGSADHHKLFLIAVDRPLGLNHIAFEVEDFGEVVSAGEQLAGKGWASAWGPGRHLLGSNFFWYFEAPVGGHMEYTCDIDQLDERWTAGVWPLTPEYAAMYTLKYDPENLKGVENIAKGVE